MEILLYYYVCYCPVCFAVYVFFSPCWTCCHDQPFCTTILRERSWSRKYYLNEGSALLFVAVRTKLSQPQRYSHVTASSNRGPEAQHLHYKHSQERVKKKKRMTVDKCKKLDVQCLWLSRGKYKGWILYRQCSSIVMITYCTQLI